MATTPDSDAGGMPQLEFDTWASQIFWSAVALFLLYQVLAKRVMPKIATTLEDRHHAIADDLDDAASLKVKAEEAQGAYQQALADARARSTEIADKTKAEIDEQVAAANVKAEAEISARTAEGEQRIAEIRKEAAASARQVAEETARAIVEKIAPGSADPSAISSAVDRALAARGIAR